MALLEKYEEMDESSGTIEADNSCVNLLLDALGVHGDKRTKNLGVTRRLLTSSLGASTEIPITTAKRNLVRGYKAFLLNSSSGINDFLEIEKKVKHLEHLIAHLEDAVRLSKKAPASTSADDNMESAMNDRILSMLIVLTRLIGNVNNQTRSSIRNFDGKQMEPPTKMDVETSSKYDNSRNSKSKPRETTLRSSIFSTQTSQINPSSSPVEEYSRLVRECIYALQGIDGSRINFRRGNNGTINNYFSGALDICPHMVHNITYSGTLSSTSSSCISQMDQQKQEPFVTLDAIQLCGECGWLLLCIQQFINQNIASCDVEASGGRMVARALAEALSEEITEYHSFIANILEVQQSKSDLFTLNQLVCTVRNAKVKLHALALLVEDCNKKKKYPAHHYSSVVHIHAKLRKASSSTSSRRSASSSHNPLNHSVTLSTLFNKIASRTSLPLYQKMFEWVFFGMLVQKQYKDPNRTEQEGPEEDFFITENVSVEDAYLWWESSGEISSRYAKNHDTRSNVRHSQLAASRYSLDQLMIPVFISHEMAQVMLNIGKGVNFVRKCLGDNSWDLMQQLELAGSNNNDNCIYENTNISKETLGFCYGSGDILQKTLNQCQTIVHSHILTMLLERHSLHQHLLLMKKCLLLSQGDFVQTLIESLDETLAKHFTSATPLMTADDDIDTIDGGGGASLTLPPRYTLQMLVDNALHNTNYFKLLPETFLSRIVVVILTSAANVSGSVNLDEDREMKGLFKWDDFSLEYTIDAPLTSVIHPVAQARYQLMFRLIWRCKHIEYMLSKNWRSAVTVHRTVLKMCKEEAEQEQGSSGAGRSARAVLRRTAMTRHKAMHFFSNFLSYISYEVLENSWKELQLNLSSAKTLDDIVRSHDLYMKNIVTKSMLLAKDDDPTCDHSFSATTIGSEERTPSLAMLLTSVLYAAARFTSAEERVFTNALNGLEKASRMRRVAENRLKENKWGYEKTPLFSTDVMEAAFSDNNAAVLSLLISSAEELDVELKKFITKLFRQTDDRGDDEENDDYTRPMTVEATPDFEGTPTPPGLRHSYLGEFCDQGLKDSLQFLAFRLDFNRYYDKECRT
jgi:hypothetical protein